MKTNYKTIIAVLALLCIALVVPNRASAGLRDKFSRWDTFNGFSKFSNDSTSPLQKLTELKGKFGSTNSSFSKLAGLSLKFSENLSPSFARIAMLKNDSKANLKSSFAKMANLSNNMTRGLRPSFTKLASIKTTHSGSINSSFERLANLNSNMTGGLKPSFVKLASISSSLAGAVKPSFARLATFNANLVGGLKPAFERMANINMKATVSRQLVKLASINANIAGGLNPAFERLANTNSKMVRSLSPAFSRLSSLSDKLAPTLSPKLQALTNQRIPVTQIGKTHALYTKSQGLKTIRLTAGKPLSFAPIAAPTNLYRLSVKPETLQGLSAGEFAELITRDLHLIQPNLGVRQSLQPIQAVPQNISLISLLAIKAK